MEWVMRQQRRELCVSKRTHENLKPESKWSPAEPMWPRHATGFATLRPLAKSPLRQTKERPTPFQRRIMHISPAPKIAPDKTSLECSFPTVPVRD
ncbi:hypothetical protein VTH06DRAFT_4128 [Thermothelomyces fergusii]